MKFFLVVGLFLALHLVRKAPIRGHQYVSEDWLKGRRGL